MKITKLLNPLHVYRKREHIVPELNRIGRRAGLFLDANDRKLRAFRNAHRDRRGFLIGNGPSLRIDDLDRLKNEITFACNKIYLAFDQTDWRPSYYGAEDVLIFRNPETWRAVRSFTGSVKFFPTYADTIVPRVPEAIYFPHVWEDAYPDPPSFSTDATRCVYSGNTVMYLMLQFAYFMGIQELYILGADFNYQMPREVVATHRGDPWMSRVGTERNYFHPDYHKPGELTGSPHLARQETAFRAAKTAYDTAGRRILNATRGGRLEVFPRVDLDALF